MTVLAIVLIILSLPLFKMGFGSLKDRASHEEYGVESVGTHTAFSWVLIVLAAILACSGGVLLAG